MHRENLKKLQEENNSKTMRAAAGVKNENSRSDCVSEGMEKNRICQIK